MAYTTKAKVKAYHGTYSENVASILKDHFRETTHNLWLGNGAYFFVKGISPLTCIECGRLWVVDEYNMRKDKSIVKDELTVLEAEISINQDKYLDLTTDAGLLVLNEFRQGIVDKLEDGGKVMLRDFLDAQALSIIRAEAGIELVKGHVYMQLGLLRKYDKRSRSPNVTIFVVNNPKKHISKYSIKEVFKEAL